jgi:hypothetical protein
MNTHPQPQPDSLGHSTQWIQACLPDPKVKDFHTQFGVFCEEVTEVIKEVSPRDDVTHDLLRAAQEAMSKLGDHLKASNCVIYIDTPNRKNFLKEMCDVAVTLTTTAHTQKMNIEGGMHAVNNANFSKFDHGKPLFDANGKVVKGPNYKKADLSLFV